MPGLGREEAALLTALARHRGPTPSYLRVFVPLPQMCPWRLFARLWPGQTPDWAWSAPRRAAGGDLAVATTAIVGRGPLARGSPADLRTADAQLRRWAGRCASVGRPPPGGWDRWPWAAVAWPFDPRTPAAAPWARGDGGWRVFALSLCAQDNAAFGATWLVAVPAALRAWRGRGGAPGPAARAAARRWCQRHAALASALQRGAAGHRLAPPPAAPFCARFPAGVTSSAAAFRARVQAATGDIRAGHLRKVVLARMCVLRPPPGQALSAWQTAWRLRATHPSARIFLHALAGGGAFVGASPETLIEMRAGHLFTHALAGTAKIIDGNARHAARSLADSDKDQHEHALVVAAVRRALRALHVRVKRVDAPRALQAGSLMHLETPFVGRAPAGLHMMAAAARLHPTPALAGTPRASAVRRLRREEPWRGLYGGAVGWWSPADGHLAVAIRSALCTPSGAALFAGAGIVHDSQPATEWQETQNKLTAMRAAMGMAHPAHK